MKDSKKLEFQRRLSQCNRGEMIVIMYDILFAYEEDAYGAHERADYDNYKDAVRKAQNTLDTLIGALDFSYEISKDFYRLYITEKKHLERAVYENRTAGLEDASRILKPLYESFVQVAKADTSGPLMRNTQQVYAGMTYGKTSLNEMYSSESNRGFLA